MKRVNPSTRNMKVAFINLLPAIIYGFLLMNHLPDGFNSGLKIFFVIVFVVVYMALTLLPFVSFAVNIASAMIYIGLLWVLCAKTEIRALEIVLKILSAAFIGLLELSIAINMTVKHKEDA